MTDSIPLLGAARVRDLLERHRVVPNKSWGQNFVVDPNTIRKMLRVAAPARDERVLEVGPGAGSLTLGLAAAAESVVAIERDARLLPVLEEVVGGLANVELVHGDALAVDLSGFGATSLVANLPYNIAASVVLEVLEKATAVRTLTVMTQREVGERLAASRGTKAYGATSVLVAFFGRATVEASISPNAFWPVPNVDSVVVRIVRRSEPDEVDQETFFRVVKAAFAQRRKTLRNALTSLTGSTDGAERLLEDSGIEGRRRAETLTPRSFIEIARRLS